MAFDAVESDAVAREGEGLAGVDLAGERVWRRRLQ
jgi:hypothetical protein